MAESSPSTPQENAAQPMAPNPHPREARQVIEEVKRLAGSIGASHERLASMLQLLAYDRVARIAQWLRQRHGAVVLNGPFKGMAMPLAPSDGCDIPKLLGSYEQELHRIWQRYRERPVDWVANIGCAEGYYAIGLARLMPEARILAVDTDSIARERCAVMARANGVDGRLEILPDADQLPRVPLNGRGLIVMDIEGAERDILAANWLSRFSHWDAVIELHGDADAANAGWLHDRFAATHDIDVVLPNEALRSVPPELTPLEEIDRLLAIWEWRREATPWAYLRALNVRT